MAIWHVTVPEVPPGEREDRIESYLQSHGHTGAKAAWWTEDRNVLVVDSETDPTTDLQTYVSAPTAEELRLIQARALVQDVRQVVAQIEALPDPTPTQIGVLRNSKLLLFVVRYLWREADQ